jgi:glucose-6-phosphate 1-dehydrogenase
MASNGTKISPSDAIGTGEDMTWLKEEALNIVVIGASGDLAKKKTFPSLVNLFDDNLLPVSTTVWGYARSDMTDDDLRNRIRPYLKESGHHSDEVVETFLSLCHYKRGNGYGDIAAFDHLRVLIEANESENPNLEQYNRLFYFATPPNVFGETAIAIKKTCMQKPSKGFSRIIVEKPFGRDLESFEQLNKTLSDHFKEEELYRIDRKS